MSKIIFFLLFLLPFLVLPFGISQFETPKVYVAEISIIILILWYISRESVSIFYARKYIPFFLLGLCIVVAALLYPTQTSLFGNVYRQQGAFIYLLLLIFSLLSSRISFELPSPKTIVLLLILHVVLAIFIQGKIDNRLIGSLGEANSLAASTIFLLSCLLASYMKRNPHNILPTVMIDRFFLFLGSSTSILLIFLSGSRSGIIALSILMFYFFVRRYSLRFAFILSGICLCLSLMLPFFDTQALYENRAVIWQTTVPAIIHKPILGWGIGNTEYALRYGSENLQNPIRFGYVDHTHNLLLEQFVQLGVVGGVIFVYLVYKAIVLFVRRKEAGYLIILLGLLLMTSFNPVSIVVLIQFWWIVGQGFSEEKPLKVLSHRIL